MVHLLIISLDAVLELYCEASNNVSLFLGTLHSNPVENVTTPILGDKYEKKTPVLTYPYICHDSEVAYIRKSKFLGEKIETVQYSLNTKNDIYRK